MQWKIIETTFQICFGVLDAGFEMVFNLVIKNINIAIRGRGKKALSTWIGIFLVTDWTTKSITYEIVVLFSPLFVLFFHFFWRLAGLSSFVDDNANVISDFWRLWLQKYFNKDIAKRMFAAALCFWFNLPTTFLYPTATKVSRYQPP